MIDDIRDVAKAIERMLWVPILLDRLEKHSPWWWMFSFIWVVRFEARFLW